MESEPANLDDVKVKVDEIETVFKEFMLCQSKYQMIGGTDESEEELSSKVDKQFTYLKGNNKIG